MIVDRTGGPICILLVEDNAGDAELIRDILAASLISCERLSHVTSLREASAFCRDSDIDVVLLDLRLPDGSGVECVATIRACGDDFPIVVLTGLDDEELALACLAAGAQDYLPKQDLQPQNLRRAVGYGIARIREAIHRRQVDAMRERHSAIVESSSDAIVSMTPDGIVTSWNRGAELIFGYRRDDAIGKHVRELMRSPNDVDRQALDEYIRRAERGDASDAQEIVWLRQDGVPITLSVVTCALPDGSGGLTGIASICRDVSEAKHRDDELRRRAVELQTRNRQMRALTVRLNAVREEERTRLSRQVHDELGQALTSLKMDLRWTTRRLTPDHSPVSEAILARLAETERLLDESVATVQRIAVELRPSALDVLGLPSAIRGEARRFEARSGIAAAVEVRAVSLPDPKIATALFRILQELLTNVARHAQASRVCIGLEQAGDCWVLQVEDNGVGLRGSDAHRLSSLGLLGMQERADALGGSVSLRRGKAGGTLATARIPLAHETARGVRACGMS